MKKALTKSLLLAVTVVILAGIIPLSASAQTSSNKTQVFSFLTEKLGFNSAAACGIMANIEKESNFKPTLVITDSNGLLSGGLCQWNGGRFRNLKNYCNSRSLNYLSIAGQLSYLKHELSGSYYYHIYKYLKNVPDTAQGAYDAAYYWCYYFEIPASRGSRSVQRGSTARNSYWPKYGDKEISTPEISFKGGDTTYDIKKDSITVNWTSAGKYVDQYIVYLAEKDPETGKYDYANAKRKFINKNTTSFTIPARKATGSYRVYVVAYNYTTGQEEQSNLITFKVTCDDHSFKTKVTKAPTEKADGKKTLTCKKCGYKKTATLTLAEYFDSLKVEKSRITGVAETKIKVRWNELEMADGYRVYVKENGKWIKVGEVKQKEDKALMVRDLTPGKTYSFRVKAYKEIDGKRVYSVASSVVTAKTKKAA